MKPKAAPYKMQFTEAVITRNLLRAYYKTVTTQWEKTEIIHIGKNLTQYLNTTVNELKTESKGQG